MKKTLLIATTVSCINLGMYAQTSTKTASKITQTELLADATTNNGEEKTSEKEAENELKTKAETRQIKKEQRKKKKGLKDMSLGAKIGAGALVIATIALYLLTGGEGVSSR